MQKEKFLQNMSSEIEGIRFSLDKDINPQEALALYAGVNWLNENETEETIRKIFQNSFAVASAYDIATGRLAGFFRALSDGAGDAYMVDLLVDPACRKKGIGKALVQLLSSYLKSQNISWIVCIGVPGTENFYRKCGGKKMEQYTPYRFGEEI